MITATAELVDRDPAVAGLPVLLDGARFERWLDDQLPELPDGLRPRYLRYKPGTSLVAGIASEQGPLLAYAVSAAAAPKLDKLVRKAPPGSVLVHDRRLRIALATARADRDLPALADLLTEGVRTLAYKPQRRWVGQDGDGSPILRCYRPADAGRMLRGWPDPAGYTGVRIPSVQHRTGNGKVAVQRLTGRPAHLLDDEHRLPGLSAAGRALAHWHAQAPAARHSVDRADPRAIAGQLITLLPEQTERIRRLADELIDHPPAAADQGWCHGDFSADQVLIAEPAAAAVPAIIDWDRSGHGPRAADLATADAAAVDDPGDPDDAGWDALLAGYASIRQVPPDLDRHRALTGFARAAEPFRTARADWASAVTARLDRVESLL